MADGNVALKITVDGTAFVNAMLDLGDMLLEVLDADAEQVAAWERRKGDLVRAMADRVVAEQQPEERNAPWHTDRTRWQEVCSRYGAEQGWSAGRAGLELASLWRQDAGLYEIARDRLLEGRTPPDTIGDALHRLVEGETLPEGTAPDLLAALQESIDRAKAERHPQGTDDGLREDQDRWAERFSPPREGWYGGEGR